jgi:hypothetical protein
MANIYHISSLNELDSYLSNQKTNECNLIGYFWHEYGWLPVFMNEMFSEFFQKVTGKCIGLCFQGHELFYEDKVDDLVVLDGFIDTTKAYSNNRESDLLRKNFSLNKDKGIAFWYTIRNFDEDAFDSVISKYDFKNTLHSIGKTTTWDYGLYPNASKPYVYASGEMGDFPIPTDCRYGSKVKGKYQWQWQEDKIPNKSFDRYVDGEYDAIFVKNTWKTRSSNKGDSNNYFVGDGKQGNPGYGYLNHQLFINICNKYIEKKRKLVIIHDLVKYDHPESEYLIDLDMVGFLDVKKYISYISHANIFISAATGQADMALYYCPDKYYVLLDDMQGKLPYYNNISKKYNKETISVKCKNYSGNEWDKLNNFIDKVLN